MLIKNKNILYIGPYRQQDGWGQAAKDYILSLNETDNNIHCQPVYMSNSIDENIDPKIKAIENNQLSQYDVVIQNVLPMMMTKTHLYNVGLLFIENQNFCSESVQNLNLMDEIWVSSNLEKKSLTDGGVKTPIKVIGHAINVQKSQNNIFTDAIKDHYKFYFIGEYIQRKNIKDLVTAFHLEFDITEKVSLVLKLSGSGNNFHEFVEKDLQNIKAQLRTRKYFHNEILITNRLSNDQMNGLHNSADCFVVVSYGEAFCRPAAEALCNGNYLISSSNIGILDYTNPEDVDVIDCYPSPVILDNPQSMASLDIYNANETWYVPNILDLRKKMRLAFENRKQNNNSNFYIEQFSYKNIGQKICSPMP